MVSDKLDFDDSCSVGPWLSSLHMCFTFKMQRTKFQTRCELLANSWMMQDRGHEVHGFVQELYASELLLVQRVKRINDLPHTGLRMGHAQAHGWSFSSGCSSEIDRADSRWAVAPPPTDALSHTVFQCPSPPPPSHVGPVKDDDNPR